MQPGWGESHRGSGLASGSLVQQQQKEPGAPAGGTLGGMGCPLSPTPPALRGSLPERLKGRPASQAQAPGLGGPQRRMHGSATPCAPPHLIKVRTSIHGRLFGKVRPGEGAFAHHPAVIASAQAVLLHLHPLVWQEPCRGRDTLSHRPPPPPPHPKGLCRRFHLRPPGGSRNALLPRWALHHVGASSPRHTGSSSLQHSHPAGAGQTQGPGPLPEDAGDCEGHCGYFRPRPARPSPPASQWVPQNRQGSRWHPKSPEETHPRPHSPPEMSILLLCRISSGDSLCRERGVGAGLVGKRPAGGQEAAPSIQPPTLCSAFALRMCWCV